MPTKITVLADIDVFYISAGKFHSAVVDSQRNLYIWGSNKYGQLGINHNELNALKPIYTEFDFEVGKIACGYKNTLLLTGDCLVYGCGINDNEQISISDINTIKEFTVIEELNEIERIFCTDLMMAMTKDYSVYLWGGNYSDIASNNRPKLIEGFENKTINAALGSGFVILIDKDMFVYATGDNSKGQLGYSDTLKEYAFGIIDKLCQNPLKSVTCGKDFVIGLGGIVVPNPNKLKIYDSQYNLRLNTNLQIQKAGSHLGSYQATSPKEEEYTETIIKGNNGEIFQSFHSPNQNPNTNRMYTSELPSFPEGEYDRIQSNTSDKMNTKVTEAVEGFKSEVYSIIKDIKTKNPDIEKYIDKNKLKQLKMKEDLLNDILNSYAKDAIQNDNNILEIRREILEILRGIIAEYNKQITFKGYKKHYKSKINDLRVR